MFTRDRPIVFAFHGYPWLIHRLTYRRANHSNLHVRGYVEEGTTTTPFDMTVLNRLDRYNLALDVLKRVERIRDEEATRKLVASLKAKLEEHREYICAHGEDMPEILEWRWAQPTSYLSSSPSLRAKST